MLYLILFCMAFVLSCVGEILLPHAENLLLRLQAEEEARRERIEARLRRLENL